MLMGGWVVVGRRPVSPMTSNGVYVDGWVVSVT